MRIARSALVAMLLLQPFTAGANTIVTGGDLQRICADDTRFPECTSYLEIVYKTAKAIGRLHEPAVERLAGSCGPDLGIDTVPLSIARRLAWQEYARAHPECLPGPAAEAVLLAFEARWPCGQ